MAMKKVLIAEDERPLSRALELKLTDEGIEVVVASDGKEVIDLLKGGGIDMLLLDLILPGVDGFGVLEFMKREGIKVPTFVLSNLGQSEDIEKAKSYGAEEYFVKADTPLRTIVQKVKAKLR
jgi:DNA-binding response OmpR family regulator